MTRSEAKAQTRERLLDSAAHLFARKGFGGASLEEIAESAGYSTGALYANFDNKEHLFMELVATRRARTATRRAHMVSEIFDQEVTDADPFTALSQWFVRLADRERELAPLQAEFWLYAVRNPTAMEVIAASLSDQVEALEPVVARALERFAAGSDVASRDVTLALLALFQGLMRRRRVDQAAVPDDLFGRALQWLFAGLGQTAPQTGERPPSDSPS